MKRRGKEGTGWGLHPWLLGSLASSLYATGIGDCVQDEGEDGDAINKGREYGRKHRFWGRHVSWKSGRWVEKGQPLLNVKCVWATHVKTNRRKVNGDLECRVEGGLKMWVWHL